MPGFCPDDWHGTTDEDIRQMSLGDDYFYWSDVALQELSRRRYRSAQPHAPPATADDFRERD